MVNKFKKQNLQLQVPTWLNQVQNLKGIPYLFIGLENLDNTDIKDIATNLLKEKPGFYFIISNVGDKSIFISTVAPEYIDKVKFKEFAQWLKKECNLSGGAKDNVIQGGGAKFDKSLEGKIKEWIYLFE